MLKVNDVEKNTIKPTLSQSSIFTKIILPENINKKDEISVLELPRKIENSLLNYNIYSIEEFCNYCDSDELLHVRNIGTNTREYLLELRKNLDLKFSSEINKTDEDNENSTNITILKSFIYKGESLEIDDNVNFFGLPIRIKHALLNGGVLTIGELYNYSSNDLYRLKNIGKEALNVIDDIKNSLIPVYENNRTDLVGDEVEAINLNVITDEEVNYCRTCQITPVENLIDEYLNILTDREKSIVMERFGLLDGERKTLEETGHGYGVTRERVRQIQNKGLLKLGRSKRRYTFLRLINIISYIIKKNHYLISGEEADRFLNETFKNTIYDGSSILDLLSEQKIISKVDIGGITLYTIASKCNLPQVSVEIFKSIKSNKNLITVEKIMKVLSDKNLLTFETLEFDRFISRYIYFDPRVILFDNGLLMIDIFQKKALWMELIKNVLEKEAAPLHYTEIADRVNSGLSDLPLYVDPRRVHNILVQETEFAHTGRWGMYGLSVWGLRKEGTPFLIKECLKKAGFPLHLNQIFAYVGRFKDTSKGNIRSVLETNKGFTRVGNNLFYLSDEVIKSA